MHGQHLELTRPPRRQTTMRRMLLAIALSLAFTACAQPVIEPQASTAAGTASTVVDGRLVIERNLLAINWDEGSLAWAQVLRKGQVVLEQGFDPPGMMPAEDAFPTAVDAALAPGDYRVEVYQLPCDGSCGTEPPAVQPRHPCSLDVNIEPGAVRRLVVSADNAGCQIVPVAIEATPDGEPGARATDTPTAHAVPASEDREPADR